MPAYQQKVAGGLLPRYNAGGEATAYTTFSTDDKRDVTFTFAPTSLGFFVSLRCDKDMGDLHMVAVEINGKPLTGGTCDRGLDTAGPSYGDEQAAAKSLSVRLGEPAKVHVRVVQFTPGQKAAPEKQPVFLGAMRNFQVAVAVYSPMPVADYPLPPRPDKLASLDGGSPTSGGGRVLGTVDSRSVGPNGQGAVIATLTPKGFHTEIYAVAPGAVTVTVNGRTIDLAANWTWTGKGFIGLDLTAAELRSLGLDVKTGDRVSVEFAGYRFTVAGWLAAVHEGR